MHAGLDLANEQWGEGESGLRAARNGQALCERELGRERGECTVHTLTESGWTWLRCDGLSRLSRVSASAAARL